MDVASCTAPFNGGRKEANITRTVSEIEGANANPFPKY